MVSTCDVESKACVHERSDSFNQMSKTVNANHVDAVNALLDEVVAEDLIRQSAVDQPWLTESGIRTGGLVEA